MFQPKVIKPPLLTGEVMLLEQGVHAYLLQDGRENGKLLPADGHVFLTSYRIIFLGTACNPQGGHYLEYIYLYTKCMFGFSVHSSLSAIVTCANASSKMILQ